MDTAPAAPSRTEWIDLNLIDLPQDARFHAPQDIESLAHDMRDNGQIQEIVVTPASPPTPLPEGGRPGEASRYVVVAGVGRTLAARKLNWERIRCLIKVGLSEFDRLHITFSENEERENASPIYQAKLLEKMKIAQNLKNQGELAEKVGKSQAVLSQYLSLLDLEPQVQEIIDASILTLRQLLEIKRLPNADLQLQAVKECTETNLSGKALKARVDKLVEKPSSGLRPSARRLADRPVQPSSSGRGEGEGEPDPLAVSWSRLPSDLLAATSISYTKPNQWNFSIQVPAHGPRAALAKTLMALIKVLAAGEEKVTSS